MKILVTGGTGGLGRPTVSQLVSAGHDVTVLSRAAGPGRVVADLTTGLGLRDALEGVETVVHLATTRSARDSRQTTRLLDAATDVKHLVFISIVGVDRIPFAYYTDKVVSENRIEASGMPFTIIRATQFHDFVAAFIKPQRRLPVLFTLDVPVQPIAVEEVAARLAELAGGAPAGRVADVGGPEKLTIREAAEIWQRAKGTSRHVWTLRLPGKTIAAFRAGHHMTTLPGYGRQTFAEYAENDNP